MKSVMGKVYKYTSLWLSGIKKPINPLKKKNIPTKKIKFLKIDLTIFLIVSFGRDLSCFLACAFGSWSKN